MIPRFAVAGNRQPLGGWHWWAASRPRVLLAGGRPVEFWLIESFATALGRSPITIRRWERQGLIPRCPFWINSDSARQRRRLWPGFLIDQVVRIAARYGLPTANRPNEQFYKAVLEAYEQADRRVRHTEPSTSTVLHTDV